MHKRAALSGVAVLAALGLACDQPKPKCTAAHGNFAATFRLKSGTGVCAQLTSGVLNVQSYNEPQSESNRNLDRNRPTLAIQAQEATDILWAGRETSSGTKPFAFGAFDSAEPDADGICTVSALSRAVLTAPATEDIPEMMIDECTTEPAMPAQPAIDIAYKWKNVRLVVTPAATGTKLEADLQYTVDGCTAEYTVAAVWPLVECGAPVEGSPADDEDAGADDDAGVAPQDPNCPIEEPEPPAPELTADNEICKTQGAIPDFALRCDPTILMCVLKE